MKKCIIILGMHRSGTSLVSGLVSLQGFHLGTSKMPEHKDNPKGFFENMKIFRFNDKILKDHNSSWDNNSFCYKDIKSENIKFYKQEVKKIIEEEFANAKNILIKDPRMSLLFPLWEDVLLEMGFNIKIILVFRNPIEVALSLQQRNSFALEKSIPIWFHYSLQAEKNSRKYKVFLIHYTDDFNYFEGFTTRLSNFLNVKPTKNIISSSNNLYTPKLRHHTINLEEIPKNHPSDVRTLFSIFKQKKLFLIKNNYHDFYNPAMLNSYKNNKLNIQIKDSEIKQHGLIYKSNKNCRQLEKEINNKNPPVLKKEANESILVSIIIINRDGVSHLLKMMPALYKNTSGINYELIIIDNASSDDSIIYLENCNYNIDITIIRNKNNESFSKANNKAATYAKGRYLLLLNNDTKPLKGWLDYLLHVAENNNNIGSVGSRLIYPHRKTFKKSCNIQHAGIIFQDETSFFRPFNQGNGASHRSQSIDNYGAKSALTAACLLVPTDVYKEVGGLDEQYIFGYEDVDFGLKLLKAGYQNYYCPDSVLFHYEFGTQEKDHDNDIIKRRKSNIDLLRQRWFTTIKQSYWEEKLYNKSHLFSETALQIAIIVTDYGKKITAKDYILSKELAKHFNTFGWTTYFLSPINNNYYKIDNEIDVVISLLETYDLEKIPKREKRLTTIAWTTRKHLDLWCKAPSFNQYDIVFTPDQNSCDYIKAHNYQKSVVFPDSTSPKPSTQKSSYNQAQLVRNTLVRHFLSTSVAINIPSPTWIGIDSCADYHIAILLKQKLEQQGYYALLQIYPEWESNNAMGYDVVLVLRGMHQYKPKHHQINIMWNTICSDIITEKECKEYDAIFPMSCKEKDGDGDLSTPIKKIFKSTNTNYFHSLSIKSNQQKMLFKGNLDNTYNKIITDLTLIENNLSSYDKKRKSIMYNQHEIEDCIINNESSKYYNLAFKALILTNKNNNIRNLKDFINRLDSITTFEQKITDLLEHSNINIDQEIINEFISIYKNNKNKQLRKLNTIHDDLYLHYESFVHNDSLLRNEISQLEIKLVIAKKMKASSKEEADNKLIVYMQGADEKLRIAHLNASNKAKEIKEGILRANERVKIAKKETKWKEEQKLKTFKREADEKLRIALLNASNKAKEIKEGILRADGRVKIAKQEAKQEEEKKLKIFKHKADEQLRIAHLNARNKAKEIKEGLIRADKKVKIAKQEAEKKLQAVNLELKSTNRIANLKLKEISQCKSQFKNARKEREQFRQQCQQLDSKVKESIESLSVADEVFNKVYTSRSWNKKLGRIIKGKKYFKLRKNLFPWMKKSKKKLFHDKALIIDSGLFSLFYYLTHNPDVWYEKVDPLSHFCQHGWKQGRNPGPNFNIKDYISMYDDVERTGMNPLIHYIKFGKKEGRRTVLNLSSRKKESKQYKKKNNTISPALSQQHNTIETKGHINTFENGVISGHFISRDSVPVIKINGFSANNINIDPESAEFTVEIESAINSHSQIELLSLSEKGVSPLADKLFKANWAIIDKYADLEKAVKLCQNPDTVAITVWDGAHNPIGRAKVLYDIISTKRPAIIIAYVFGTFGNHLWGPLRSSGANILLIPYKERLAYHHYFQQRNIKFNTVWICKYRLHSFELASMISKPETACILDMDDNEDVFVSSKNSELQPYGIFSKNKADYFLNKMPIRSVASTSLLENYGGRLMRHARQEYINPNPSQIIDDTNKMKTAVFIGTIRPHKNISSLVSAVAKFNQTSSDKVKLAIGGDFDPPSLKQTLNTPDTLILDEIRNNELFATLAQFDVLITGFPDANAKSVEINKYQITSKIGDGLAIGRPVLTPYSPAVADLENIAGLFIFTQKNFSEKLKQAMSYKEKVTLPKEFTLDYSYQTFETLEKVAKEKSLANNIFEMEALYHKELKDDKKRNIVLIWKQHDSGVYGRRIDHIARHYKQKHPDCNITVIEAMTGNQINQTLSTRLQFDNSTAIVNEILSQKLYQYDLEGVNYRMISYDNSNDWNSFENHFGNFLNAESINPYNTVMILFPLHPVFDKILHLISHYKVIVDLVDNQINWITTPEGRVNGLKQYYDLISIADKVVSNSPQNIQHFRKLGFFEKIEPEVISNWYTLPNSITFQRKINAEEINLLYSGNMNDRIDWGLLSDICKLLAKFNGYLHIAGSSIRRAPEMQELLREPNCIYHGVVREDQLLRLLQHINFAVVPHIEDKISKFMDPIKLKMYVKLGIPSLTTKLPGLSDANPLLIIADSKNDFLSKLNDILSNPSFASDFDDNRYDETGEKYSGLIDQLFINNIITTQL